VALPPRYLFGSALVAQLVALIGGLPALADIARGVLALALVVGLLALTVLLVDYTITPVGSRAHRLRGLASGWTSTMVVGFTFAWYLDVEGATAGAVFLVELVSFGGGLLFARDALRVMQTDPYGDVAV
jgi:hypothetical protein